MKVFCFLLMVSLSLFLKGFCEGLIGFRAYGFNYLVAASMQVLHGRKRFCYDRILSTSM